MTVVGGAVGAVTGTVGGILGVDTRPRFHEYVARQHHPSYHYGDFRVCAILPQNGVTYYDIPNEYHVQGYRYAYVNDHAVLVDPRTRQIVEIVDKTPSATVNKNRFCFCQERFFF